MMRSEDLVGPITLRFFPQTAISSREMDLYIYGSWPVICLRAVMKIQDSCDTNAP